jgi:hypothetical protein
VARHLLARTHHNAAISRFGFAPFLMNGLGSHHLHTATMSHHHALPSIATRSSRKETTEQSIVAQCHTRKHHEPRNKDRKGTGGEQEQEQNSVRVVGVRWRPSRMHTLSMLVFAL